MNPSFSAKKFSAYISSFAPDANFLHSQLICLPFLKQNRLINHAFQHVSISRFIDEI